MSPALSIADRLARFNLAVGRLVSWLCLAMVLVTFVVVVLRYLFDLGWIWVQESVTWMHAAVFMLAAAYTLAEDKHVRVDIFYRNLPPRRKALVDLIGNILFLLPVTGFIVWTSWDYVTVSWSIKEASREAGGLVYPFPALMKSFIPVTALLLMLQGISITLRCIVTIRTGQDSSIHSRPGTV